jgi:flagellar hook-basal body complex protein FliE
MDPLSMIPKIGPITGPVGVERPASPGKAADGSPSFGDTLKDAIRSVDRLQQESEVAQASFARGEDVDLHDVLIKIEEAEVSFKTMMEVRNKLVDAYREIMRMGA